jgi:heterodisulfide reductase subunit C
MVGQIIFTVLLLAISALAFVKYSALVRNIRLGKAEQISGDGNIRLKNMMLVAFGQSKMFKRPLAAILHLFVYVAFVITQVELIEIVIDGISGQHRFFWGLWKENTLLAGFYTFIISFIEILSVLALVATFAFLSRRNLLKIPRFRKSELNGWPFLDANIILYAEIVLVACIFTMNSADMAMHKNEYGFAVSGLLSGIWGSASEGSLEVAERIGWWGHILVVFAFLAYLPYSKHLHIMLAFPNTYFSRLTPKGYVNNMPEITKEIKLMMNPDAAFAAPAEGDAPAEPVKFGAKDVTDLSWKNLLDAMSCTECGRCTAACPANQTGKLLSPRKIMMDTRDRLEEVGNVLDANNGVWKDDGKSLIENGYITVEELRACTTCNACVEECPVTINPLDIILQLRRNLVMEDSNAPAEWTGMFANMENNGAPWQFSQQDRLNWAND